MSKRKYVRYTVVADFGTTVYHTECYIDAFSTYQKTDVPKTMYGFDEQDTIFVICSKG